MSSNKVGFISLGCPKALVDSERILTQLRIEGYEITPHYEDAGVVIVNTCGFIDAAKEERLEAIGEAVRENGRVLVKQIAGLVARRIVTDPVVGDSVERGRRFGLIRFGSRVDLFVPRHWEVLSSVGDRVRVGSTVLARQRAGA